MANFVEFKLLGFFNAVATSNKLPMLLQPLLAYLTLTQIAPSRRISYSDDMSHPATIIVYGTLAPLALNADLWDVSSAREQNGFVLYADAGTKVANNHGLNPDSPSLPGLHRVWLPSLATLLIKLASVDRSLKTLGAFLKCGVLAMGMHIFELVIMYRLQGQTWRASKRMAS